MKVNLSCLIRQQLYGRFGRSRYKAYVDFKGHDKFLPYLEHMSTLKYYSKTNIGSRPQNEASPASWCF